MRYQTIAELTRDELEQVAAEFSLIFPNARFTPERMRNLMIASALYRDPDHDPEQRIITKPFLLKDRPPRSAV